MTKKTPKPTAQHMKDLSDFMDTRPEGVTTRQVQNTLSVSPTLAKAALVEIGAVEQDGKWVFADVESEPVVEPVDYNVSDLVEAFAANPPDFDPLVKSVAAAKSDFARVLEAERQRVYDAVAIGGTVERLAELTGLHVDDVQQHLDALIVDGAIFREPIIIGYGHKVAV